tara:strand:+ start:985 stop:1290 length:306 start_codon:yes stop_codon:yes gene_type:complete
MMFSVRCCENIITGDGAPVKDLPLPAEDGHPTLAVVGPGLVDLTVVGPELCTGLPDAVLPVDGPHEHIRRATGFANGLRLLDVGPELAANHDDLCCCCCIN